MSGGVRESNPNAYDKVRTAFGKVDGSHVKVGVCQNDNKEYELKEGEERSPDGPLTLAEIGAIHEFGAPNAGIPERSFIRAGVQDRMVTIRSMFKTYAKKINKGEMTQQQALGLVGLQAQAGIQAKFTDGTLAPNAPSTIAAKGSSRPLIDTGQLRAAISYEIVIK